MVSILATGIGYMSIYKTYPDLSSVTFSYFKSCLNGLVTHVELEENVLDVA